MQSRAPVNVQRALRGRNPNALTSPVATVAQGRASAPKFESASIGAGCPSRFAGGQRTARASRSRHTFKFRCCVGSSRRTGSAQPRPFSFMAVGGTAEESFHGQQALWAPTSNAGSAQERKAKYNKPCSHQLRSWRWLRLVCKRHHPTHNACRLSASQRAA